MAFEIPKIEYLNDTTTGTTSSGSGTIASVADITVVQSGMYVSGTGIPAGAMVDTVGATSFTLASGVQATASATVTLTFKHMIEFDYPAIEPKGSMIESTETVTTSISGVRQVSVNYLEEKREMVLSFLSPAIYELVQDFFSNHALYGRTFRWYQDKTSGTYTTYELDKLKFEPEKITSRSATTYVWRVPLTMRRAL